MMLRDKIHSYVGFECNVNLTSKVQLNGKILEAHHDYFLLENSNPTMEPNIIPYTGVASLEKAKEEIQ